VQELLILLQQAAAADQVQLVVFIQMEDPAVAAEAPEALVQVAQQVLRVRVMQVATGEWAPKMLQVAVEVPVPKVLQELQMVQPAQAVKD
jgi:hypothetical protein